MGDTSKEHNRFYIPPEVKRIKFKYRVYNHDPGDPGNVDQLVVSMNDPINSTTYPIFSKWLNHLSNDLIFSFDVSNIPDNTRIRTIKFEILKGGLTLNSEVWIDDVEFMTTQDIAPSESTLVSPYGAINDYTPTYTWNTVDNATWYYLWVNGPAGNVIKKWYRDSDVNAGSTSSITPPQVLLPGDYTWWIQTYNNYDYGPWSDLMEFEVIAPSAPPGTATLTSPSGSITDCTPDYIWEEVSGATWYYLWVNGPTGNVIKKWYKSADVCSSGTCSITPSVQLVNGAHKWWVRAWNSAGYGSWSTGMNFTVSGCVCTTAPGAATLTSPTGNITDSTPTYTWEEEGCATWYRLWVNDSSGKVFARWYKSADVCSGGICSTMPSTVLANDNHTWWIRTWNSEGYGPWSSGMNFSVQ